MRFLTYYADNTVKLGIVTDNGVIDVASASQATGINAPTTPDAFYNEGNTSLPKFADLLNANIDAQHILDESNLTLAPIVPNPGKILCIGLNYSKHAAESGMAEPKTPVLFSKFNNSIAAPNEDVPLSAEFTQTDYEAELVVVMGKTARNVSEAEALDYVLGYCNGNDLSERRLQMLTGQWLLGKTLDKFLPIGPYLVTADEAGDPADMRVQGWLNGEQRQDSNTNDMIFSVAQVIAYTSKYMALNAGDIISTGTPEGVILGMENKVWLKAGDEYTVEIGNLGRLTNKMIAG